MHVLITSKPVTALVRRPLVGMPKKVLRYDDSWVITIHDLWWLMMTWHILVFNHHHHDSWCSSFMIHDDHHLNHHDQCALLGKFCELDNILFFYLHFELITVDLDDDNQLGMVRALFSLSHCPSQVASSQPFRYFPIPQPTTSMRLLWTGWYQEISS